MRSLPLLLVTWRSLLGMRLAPRSSIGQIRLGNEPPALAELERGVLRLRVGETGDSLALFKGMDHRAEVTPCGDGGAFVSFSGFAPSERVDVTLGTLPQNVNGLPLHKMISN